MNRLRSVSLIALTIAAATITLASAQSPAMQKGISVQLPRTNNATSMPAADNGDAWIIAVTADGSIYFGIDKVTPADLADKMKITPRNRDAKLYIKADARAPYASVERVLEVARIDSFEGVVLLTSHRESVAPGTLVSPKGLEVSLNTPSDVEPVVVQLGGSRQTAQAAPKLTVNNTDIPNNSLESALRESLQNRSDRVVVIKVAGATSFDQVAHIIDACYAAGARVILPSSAS
jgi:biopolymer transport protein ExbD